MVPSLKDVLSKEQHAVIDTGLRNLGDRGAAAADVLTALVEYTEELEGHRDALERDASFFLRADRISRLNPLSEDARLSYEHARADLWDTLALVRGD